MPGGATNVRAPEAGSRDYGELTAPVPRDELRAFRRFLRTTNWRASPSLVARSIGLIFLLVILWLVPAIICAGAVAFAATLATGPFTSVLIATVVEIVGIALLVAVSWWFLMMAKRDVVLTRPLRKWFRLDRFARSNNWLYLPDILQPAYPGCIFIEGQDRKATDVVAMKDDRWVEFGNYRYAMRSNTLGVRRWGYIRLLLDRPLPHMVLESTAHRRLFARGLPVTFKSAQTLSLEGDFDKYFTLFAPRGYERDALYVFTPDLMALLIDNASNFDVEIIDREMYVYATKPFDMKDPATFDRVDSLVRTVASKTWTQTTRYGDERAGQFAGYRIAPQGRRLRRSVSIASVIGGILIVAVHFIGPLLSIAFQH